uniref:Uncharacterized protein n=1 Tax=Timema monikensis TaxID=170555 RepID=A0A7R9HL17_9NEOP|nr:unnamed protein product [Timema monikensis]
MLKWVQQQRAQGPDIGVDARKRMGQKGLGRLNLEEVYPNLCGEKVENHSHYNRPGSNPDILFFDILVYCEYATTEPLSRENMTNLWSLGWSHISASKSPIGIRSLTGAVIATQKRPVRCRRVSYNERRWRYGWRTIFTEHLQLTVNPLTFRLAPVDLTTDGWPVMT